MFTPSKLLTLILGAGLVAAHGIIKNVKINGKTYPGANGPGSDPSNSPVRAVASGDPIDDVTSESMLCGTSSKKAPISAAVSPGDKVTIAWQAETGINWFHNVGPIQTYMAKCDGDCKDFTPTSSTNWFKISALGLKPDGKTWYQADMDDGSPTEVTIPSDLPNGNYLMRHEVLALQNGMTKGLAEFYPQCVQMKVSGGSNVNANAMPGPTANFPGAYKATDPGILVNVYNPGFKYEMPGPAIANIAKGTSTSSSDNGDDNSDPTGPTEGSSSAAPSPTAPANAGENPTAPSEAPSAPEPTMTGSSNNTSSKQCRQRNSKGNQKRALRAHAKRRLVKASY